MKKIQEISDEQLSESYKIFLTELEKEGKIESKIRRCLDFMKECISKEKTPAFQEFWAAKRLCLEFFKENLTPRNRAILWEEYIELSEEIRRVKKILDEESSFAEEQIALALSAVEKDFEVFDQKVEEMLSLEIPKESKILQKNEGQYIQMQKELDLLNLFAGRLNSLRKELIKTKMRYRSKNQLFDGLKKLGDCIFPKKKELVKAISEKFMQDVQQFIEVDFVLENPPYFLLKEEIKAFQGLAKGITLHPEAFHQTREKLSQCWDKIKEKEAKHKEDQTLKREESQKNFSELSKEITLFEEEWKNSKIPLNQAEEKIEAFFQKMKDLTLGREEGKKIKKELFNLKKWVKEKQEKTEEENRKRQIQAQNVLVDRMQEVLDQAEGLSLEALVEKWETFVKEEKALLINGIEKASLTNRLDTLYDHIQEKKWQALLSENTEDLARDLHILLDERHKEKRKIRESLEELRKDMGGSNLTLEQSLLYQEVLREKKIRLDAIETMIEEIEEKLFDLRE